jgi:hypothetical protein
LEACALIISYLHLQILHSASENKHSAWGWNGVEDGFFYLPELKPESYNFSSYQHMVINIQSEKPINDSTQTVTLTKAGTLASALPNAMNVTKLTVKGQLDDDDLLLLRQMAGRDVKGHRTSGHLAELDLSEAMVEELPEKAFYDCYQLRSIILPSMLRTYGDGAFAFCPALRKVEMPTGGENCNYIQENGVIYNNDKTELIAVLPSVTDSVTIADEVTKLHDYAMAGCSRITGLQLPSSLKTLGNQALYGCYGLRYLRSCAPEVLELGDNALGEIDKWQCHLLVFGGSKQKYKKADGWKEFIGNGTEGTLIDPFDNIVEFGSTVTVRDAIRVEGEENPRFGYKVEGEALIGRPELTCEATADSPAGIHPIVISRGTVSNDQVIFINGHLTVTSGTTGIQKVTESVSSDKSAIYNLSGQKVNYVGKGIYIRNKKKYIAH